MPLPTDAITKFIQHETHRVAAFKGEWGIGKTYFWNKAWEESLQSVAETAGYKGYAYLSLFGLDTNANLEDLLFQGSTVFGKNGKRKLQKFFKKIADTADHFEFPYVKSTKAFDSYLIGKYLSEFIICIDDLERRDKSLQVEKILGLINKLSVERNCKTLLIFNQNKLENVYKKPARAR